jgi:hypothetical protein
MFPLLLFRACCSPLQYCMILQLCPCTYSDAAAAVCLLLHCMYVCMYVWLIQSGVNPVHSLCVAGGTQLQKLEPIAQLLIAG